jgi:hypothetical protein
MRLRFSMMRGMMFAAAAVCALVTAPAARAQGGPPLMTDDPGTPDPGTWEVNVAVTGDFTRGSGEYEAPVVDVNYGAGSHVQLTAAAPLALQHTAGERTHGRLGEVEAGAKWRFVDAGAALPVDVSMFPKLVFHPAIGGEGEPAELLLPLQAAREFGPFAVNVDGGRVLQRHSGARWFYGAAVQYAPVERMQWLAEMHVEAGTDQGTVRFLNAGFRRDLDAHRLLMFSIGTTVFRGGVPAETVAYVGVQFHG